MNDYLLLIHDDATDAEAADDGDRWAEYLAGLRQSGRFDGGSSIGAGECLRKHHPPGPARTPVTGYLRVRADSLDDAKRFLIGNPAYDAGATVEIRELPRD